MPPNLKLNELYQIINQIKLINQKSLTPTEMRQLGYFLRRTGFGMKASLANKKEPCVRWIDFVSPT
jgi:hypothetical protein